MLVHFQTTPFAKRCLIYEYGQAPIRVTPRGELHRQLSKKTYSTKTEKSQGYCTVSIALDLTKKLVKHLDNENVLMIGFQLDQYYTRMMCLSIVDHTALTDNDIMSFLKKYLALRQVDEDDYALSSAYKAWQRFQVDFLQKKQQSTCKEQITHGVDFTSVNYIFSFNRLVKYFDTKPERLFAHRLNSPRLVYYRKIMIFILRRYSKATYKKLSTQFKLSMNGVCLNYKNTVFLYDNNIDDQLIYDIQTAVTFLFNKSPLHINVYERLLKHERERNSKT